MARAKKAKAEQIASMKAAKKIAEEIRKKIREAAKLRENAEQNKIKAFRNKVLEDKKKFEANIKKVNQLWKLNKNQVSLFCHMLIYLQIFP